MEPDLSPDEVHRMIVLARVARTIFEQMIADGLFEDIIDSQHDPEAAVREWLDDFAEVVA